MNNSRCAIISIHMFAAVAVERPLILPVSRGGGK